MSSFGRNIYKKILSIYLSIVVKNIEMSWFLGEVSVVWQLAVMIMLMYDSGTLHRFQYDVMKSG